MLMFLLIALLVIADSAPIPKVLVSCPDHKQISNSGSECGDTPVRIQFVIKAADVQGIDCGSAGAAVAAEHSSCTDDGKACKFDDECCSYWCDFDQKICKANTYTDEPMTDTALPMGYTSDENAGTKASDSKSSGDKASDTCSAAKDEMACGLTTEECTWYEAKKLCYKAGTKRMLEGLTRRSLRSRPTSPRRSLSPPSNNFDDAVYASDSNYCSTNSDCLSFRCTNNMCDDELMSGYVGGAGCDTTNMLSILYTVTLDADTETKTVSVPDFNTNPEYTQLAFPGDFVDISFPGKIIINYRTEQYDIHTGNYNMSSVSTFTIDVGVSDEISDDNKPAVGGNYTYIRSAVEFSEFKGGAGRFNRSAFIKAVVDAINYDRKIYTEGVAEKDAEYEFNAVPSKAVSIILIEPSTKTVQYEVRVKKTDANAVRGRLLHAYFKFPLVVRLAHYGILGFVNPTPFGKIIVDSSKMVSLEPEPMNYTSYRNTTQATLMKSFYELVGPGGIVGIALACITFVVCSVFVLYRFCRQEQIATKQIKKELALKQKEVALNVREQELSRNIHLLDLEKEDLLNNTSAIKTERDTLKKEAEAAEAELVVFAQMQTEEMSQLESELDTEEEKEMVLVEQRINAEETALLAQIKQAKADGNNSLDITLPSPPPLTVNAGDAGEEDNAALLSEIEALVINADMDQVQLQKHLDERRVKMMNRTRQRNATRKAKRLAAKKKEIQVKSASKTDVKSLWDKIGILDIKVQTNEEKVDELQRRADVDRMELERETKKKLEAAHSHLEERLRKRKAKSKKKMKNTKVAAVVAPEVTSVRLEQLQAADRSLGNI